MKKHILLILLTSFSHFSFANSLEKDMKFAKDFWEKIEKIDFNSSNTKIYKGIGPHGPFKAVLEKVINGQRVIIKKEYSKHDRNLEDLKKHKNKHLKTVCVMIKKTGYDKKHNDWFWIRYKANGEVDSLLNNYMIGKFPACINCHKSATGKDFVFMNDKEAIIEEDMIKDLNTFIKSKEEDFPTKF